MYILHQTINSLIINNNHLFKSISNNNFKTLLNSTINNNYNKINNKLYCKHCACHKETILEYLRQSISLII